MRSGAGISQCDIAAIIRCGSRNIQEENVIDASDRRTGPDQNSRALRDRTGSGILIIGDSVVDECLSAAVGINTCTAINCGVVMDDIPFRGDRSIGAADPAASAGASCVGRYIVGDFAVSQDRTITAVEKNSSTITSGTVGDITAFDDGIG